MRDEKLRQGKPQWIANESWSSIYRKHPNFSDPAIVFPKGGKF